MKRCATVDGLRGVAALLVVFYHLSGKLGESIRTWAPEVIQMLFAYGFLGVQIFFVLSGYAIASSLSDHRIDGRYLAAFAIRRSIRLDPLYWLSIVVAIALALTAKLLFDLERDIPSTPRLLAHLFYLQNILDYDDIIPIYWTLCLEVQFYLTLVTSLMVLQRFFRSDGVHEIVGRRSTAALTLLTASVSVLLYTGDLPSLHAGLFLPFWFFFVLGAAVCWVARGWLTHPFFFLLLMIVAVLGTPERTPHVYTGVFTAALLYIVLMARRGDRFLADPLSQAFGRISYSLYLFHPTVGWSFISLAERMLGPKLSTLGSMSIFIFGVGVSIATAWIAYRVVERPSHRLSRKIRLSS